MGIPSRADWLISTYGMYDIVADKESLIKHYVLNMLAQTVEMFEYDGLPETIPEKEVELIQQITGNCTWAEVDGKLYVFKVMGTSENAITSESINNAISSADIA